MLSDSHGQREIIFWRQRRPAIFVQHIQTRIAAERDSGGRAVKSDFGRSGHRASDLS